MICTRWSRPSANRQQKVYSLSRRNSRSERLSQDKDRRLGAKNPFLSRRKCFPICFDVTEQVSGLWFCVSPLSTGNVLKAQNIESSEGPVETNNIMKRSPTPTIDASRIDLPALFFGSCFNTSN